MFDFLKDLGILGMNRRLGEYIIPFNHRAKYPYVDNKILTYNLSKKHQLPMPKHFFHIASHGDLKKLENVLADLESFVIKPSKGAMGNGVMLIHQVLKSKSTLEFETSKGLISSRELRHHISNILSGLYSLDGQNDEAIVQEKLLPHPILKKYCYQGIPDIRIIVFLGFPVMAMVRLPTKRSRGRSNLHQGAVGCGLNINNGDVTSCIYLDQKISNHPDTEIDFSELKIPQWIQCLELAAKCYDVTKMGYLGVDIVLDESRGPLLLEMNARPGLSIQTANGAGLIPRLEKIKKAPSNIDFQKRVEYIMNSDLTLL